MSTPYASNDLVDLTALQYMRKHWGEGVTNLSLGHHLAGELTLKPVAREDSRSWLHRGQEHANRACQRLRKGGFARYGCRVWEATFL